MYSYPAKDSPYAAAFLYPQPAPPLALPKGHPFPEFDSDGYPIVDVDSQSSIYEVPAGLSGRLTIRAHGSCLEIVLNRCEIDLVIEALDRTLQLKVDVAPSARADVIGYGSDGWLGTPVIRGTVQAVCHSLTIRSGKDRTVRVEVDLGSVLYAQTGKTEFILQQAEAKLLGDAEQPPFRSDTLIRLRSSKLFAEPSGLSVLPALQIEPWRNLPSRVDLRSDSVTVCPRARFDVPKDVPHYSITLNDESFVIFEAESKATKVMRRESFSGSSFPRIEIHGSKSADGSISIHYLVGRIDISFVTHRGYNPANLRCEQITSCTLKISIGENANLYVGGLCDDLVFGKPADEHDKCGHITIASGERAVLVDLSGIARLGEIGSNAVLRGVENNFTLCSVNGKTTAHEFVSATFDNISVDLDKLDSLRLLAALRSASVVNLDIISLKRIERGSGLQAQTPIGAGSKTDQEKRVSIQAIARVLARPYGAFRYIKRPRLVLLKDSHLGSAIVVASELVRAKSTEGTIRSSFAYQEMAWRQVTAVAAQERAILFAGRCLGFSYRVLRPIFVWLLLAVGWTIWASHSDAFDFSGAGFVEWVGRFLNVAVEPMAFFKGVESGKGLSAMKAFDQSWVLVLARFSMFVPIAFAATAVARIARGRSVNG